MASPNTKHIPKAKVTTPPRKQAFTSVGGTALTPVGQPNGKVVQVSVVAPAEVLKIELLTQTPLDDGSANDGTGKGIQKGFLFGRTYEFQVTQYSSSAFVDPASIKWKLQYKSPVNSKNGVVEKRLAVKGDTVQITFDEKDMCGCYVTVTAFIFDERKAGNFTAFHHNRFRWFDSRLVDRQIAQRQIDPWRIDQGGTSLCGMAALYYVMLKKQPQEYEKLAKELLRVGEYKIGNYTVKPSGKSAEKMYDADPKKPAYQKVNMFEVDWLVLATTRSGESNFGYDGFEEGATDQMRAVNWPGMLARLTKDVGGYGKVDSTGLFVPGLLLNKSWFGRLHDWLSDSDLQELLEIERKFNQGSQILLMVDMDVLLNPRTDKNPKGTDREVVSYGPGNLFEDSHWIVYAGGLRLEDSKMQATTDVSKAARVYFKAYTWGCEPALGSSYAYPNDSTITPNPVVADFVSRGISTHSWKSNFYGYIEAT